MTQPSVPSLEAQHPGHTQDFARLSNPASEADYAFWNANMREAERLIATYGTGIGGGAQRESGLGGSVSADASHGRSVARFLEYRQFEAELGISLERNIGNRV